MSLGRVVVLGLYSYPGRMGACRVGVHVHGDHIQAEGRGHCDQCPSWSV